MTGGGLNLFRYHLNSWMCLFVALLCSNTAAWRCDSSLLGPLRLLPPLVLPRRWTAAALLLITLPPVSTPKQAAASGAPSQAPLHTLLFGAWAWGAESWQRHCLGGCLPVGLHRASHTCIRMLHLRAAGGSWADH